ncbi:Nuclease-related domain protein [Pseudomonas aeruginosa]|nr:NERD domain-containing protein [Pseudomonas aeruginosa]RCN12924.1 Nuclease-related domain protein [Pseudomonas aeruginosa]
MDFTPIIAQVWSTLGWTIPLALLIGLLKSPWAKDHPGELLVGVFTRCQLAQQTYRRLHNVTLNTPDGSTQIDHVFLSPYGTFVLETKNMSGWIFGSEKQVHWTQKLYKRTFKSQNPLRQNYKHLKTLEAPLGVNPEHSQSVIPLVGGSTFNTEVPANVTQGIGFLQHIKSFQQMIFSEAEVNVALQALQTRRSAPTLAPHREHVQNLKRRNDLTADQQCPKKCGERSAASHREVQPESRPVILGMFSASQAQNHAKPLTQPSHQPCVWSCNVRSNLRPIH